MEGKPLFKATAILDPSGKTFLLKAPKTSRLRAYSDCLCIGESEIPYEEMHNLRYETGCISFSRGGQPTRIAVQAFLGSHGTVDRAKTESL